MTNVTTPTERALQDRERQFSLYRARKRQQYEELYADPVHGERLRKFNSTLGHFKIDHADLMVAYVASAAKNWLLAAPPDIRHAALEMIDTRIQRVRARAGLPVFSDPLPGEESDVFQLCKKALGL